MTAAEVERPKGVAPIELFVDLIFVYAVTRTSELLQHDHSPAGALRVLAVFIPVFWLWVGTTMFANLAEADSVRNRCAFFAVSLSGLGMALALPDAFGARGALFAASYWWGRLVLYLAVWRHPLRRAFVTFPIGAFITGPVLVLGSFLPFTARSYLWMGVAAFELVVPMLRRRLVTSTPFRLEHLAERYSTFIIIAVGETIVSTGAAAAKSGRLLAELLSATLGLAVCCGLWWTYFDLAAPAIERGLTQARIAIDVIRPVLSYGHLAFVAGIISVAAGIGGIVLHPFASVASGDGVLVFGGAALFLATFGFTRWRLLRSIAVPRLAGAATCCALVPIAPALSGITALSALTLLLAAVNVADHQRNRRFT